MSQENKSADIVRNWFGTRLRALVAEAEGEFGHAPPKDRATVYIAVLIGAAAQAAAMGGVNRATFDAITSAVAEREFLPQPPAGVTSRGGSA